MKEIKKATYFSIVADESRDSGNREQLAISVRYVDFDTKEIKEKFLKFVDCSEGVTGLAVKEKILGAIKEVGIEEIYS